MRIAISVSEKEKAKGKESPYFKALLTAGARPEEIELVTAGYPHVEAETFDGILLSGGADVDPALYGEEKKYDSVHVSPERDQFEFNLLDRAREASLPVFGICRGTQLINVKFGGSLYQDLDSDAAASIQHKQKNDRDNPIHSITVTEPESLLATVVRGNLQVNSLHHQAIKRVGRGLKVTAYSEDGLVEAVEAADGYPYLVAVQWHPEEIADRPEQKQLLQQFVERCRATAEQRKKNAFAAS